MGVNVTYLIMDSKYRFLMCKYGMKENIKVVGK